MRRAQLFNPRQAKTDELEDTFVGRSEMLHQLQADLVRDAGGTSVRHWQVLGPRGSGKSHLTELLARRLKAAGWAVVRMPEEQYRVASLADFLEQIVISLEGGHSRFAGLRDPQAVIDRAEDCLKERAKSGPPLLVVVENLSTFLKTKVHKKVEQARLRGLLLTEPPFVLVTTSTSIPPSTVKGDAPFYDFFQNLRLEELSADEISDLVRRRAEYDGAHNVLADWEQVEARLKTLRHFSGGNPRLVMALYRVLADGIHRELLDQLLGLLDEITPYYQARLADLAPQPQRVLVEMSLADGVLAPSEIAGRVRLPTNQVTSVIKRLEDERLVHKTHRIDGRSRLVEVSDRLFRIWLQMRESDGPNEKLRFFVEFYREWYRGREGEARDAAQGASNLFWDALQGDDQEAALDHLVNLDYLAEAMGPDSAIWAEVVRRAGEATSESVERVLEHCLERTSGDPSRAVVELALHRARSERVPAALLERLGPVAGSLGHVYPLAALKVPESEKSDELAGARLAIIMRATLPEPMEWFRCLVALVALPREKQPALVDATVQDASAVDLRFGEVVAMILTWLSPDTVSAAAGAVAGLRGSGDPRWIRSLADTATGSVGVELSEMGLSSPAIAPETATIAGLIILMAQGGENFNAEDFRCAADLLRQAPAERSHPQLVKPLRQALERAWTVSGLGTSPANVASLIRGTSETVQPHRFSGAMKNHTPSAGSRLLALHAEFEPHEVENDEVLQLAQTIAASDNIDLAIARLHPEQRPAIEWLLGRKPLD